MSIPHTVRAGETLSSIARRYNIASWREIYWHDANKDFRRKRANENLIFPGDVVIIPGGPAGPKGATAPGQGPFPCDSKAAGVVIAYGPVKDHLQRSGDERERNVAAYIEEAFRCR